jgi:hypothetical protein
MTKRGQGLHSIADVRNSFLVRSLCFMLKNIQRQVVLWIQARTGLTPVFVAGIGIAVAASTLMFVFLCVAGYMWAYSKIGPVFGGLAMAGAFLLIAAVGTAASVVARRRTQRMATLERARTARAAIDPRMLQIALQVGRGLGWQRAVPLLLLGFLGLQWVQEARMHNIRSSAGSDTSL